MSKLEYDLENFGRLCHLHDKVAKLEQALAEKEREIQQIREHEFQRGVQEGEAAAKDALAEKDRLHGCQIAELCERLNDDYRAVLIGHEKAYKQLMAQAVRFAKHCIRLIPYNRAEYAEAIAFLKEHP